MSDRHQIAGIKATEGLLSPYRAALNQQYRVVSFATQLVLSCLYSSVSAVRVAMSYVFL
jgi:hypothetical protein